MSIIIETIPIIIIIIIIIIVVVVVVRIIITIIIHVVIIIITEDGCKKDGQFLFCIDSFFYIRGKREVDMSPLSSNAFRMTTKTKNDTHVKMGIMQRTVTVQFVEQRVQHKNLFSLLFCASSRLLDVVEEVPSIFFPPVCCDSFLTMIRTR